MHSLIEGAIYFQQTPRCVELHTLHINVREMNIFYILLPQHKLECNTSLILHRMQYIYTGNHSRYNCNMQLAY